MATSPPQRPPPQPQSPNSGDPTEPANLAAAALAAPARVWSSLVSRLPPLTDSRLLAAVSDLHRRLFGGRKSHRRRPALPLPVHQEVASSVRIAREMPKAFAILEDIVEHTLSSLHIIQKSLLYWQSRDEATNSQKMYFMMFERGPRAFIEATCQTLTTLRSNGSPTQYLLNSASDMVTTKLAILKSLQRCLAAFLAEVYSEVDKCREGLTKSSDKSLHTLFVVLNIVFPKLEVSLRNAGQGQTLLSTYDGKSSELLFERLPEVDVESPQRTEALSTDAISLVYQNLQKLDSFVSSQLSSHKKPRSMTIYWLPYTCGAIGFSACSLWLLRHSSLMGSSDLDNWIQDAKESVSGFWDEHVETPIIAIRDELFETFKRTDKRVMEKEEVQLTEESLRRMLLAFCEQTSNEKLSQDASVQALMEIVMKRYEKESMHPIQNLFSGELARAMLIQIQKLKLDLQEAMLELDQILKANEINFAILAALPAFGLSLLLLLLVRAWAVHDQGAEGRGRIARRQRRLLLAEVEKRLKEFQKCMVNGMEEEACYKFGLTLYTLDRLYKAVELHAKETGEWSRYEKALTHPIQSVFNGELHALLIQIQKNVLNFQKASLAKDQLLKADEKRFAILAALPAFGLSLVLLLLVGALAMHDHGGRRRIARRQRMLLLGAVEKRLMEFQICVVNGMEVEASCKFGLALYTLDRLYKAVESHAKETGEWSSVREVIFDLAKPNLGMADKLFILSHLRKIYTCICAR